VAHLVLLHGLNNTPMVWEPVCQLLKQNHGDSITVHCPSLPPLNTVEAVAQALLAALPERFSLAGFSFGGYVAMAMLAAAPERIERIALVCSTSRADPPEARPGREKAIEIALGGGFEKMMAKQAPFTVHPDHQNDAALAATCTAMVKAYGPVHFAAHMHACVVRSDSSALLASTSKPVWLITTDSDQIVATKQVLELAQTLPNAKLVLIEKSGHMLPLEQTLPLVTNLALWMQA
jgi:pimeloyl-ACP methyl ester carboxylesterase